MMMIKTHTTQINSENNTEQPLLPSYISLLEIPTETIVHLVLSLRACVFYC